MIGGRWWRVAALVTALLLSDFTVGQASTSQAAAQSCSPGNVAPQASALPSQSSAVAQTNESTLTIREAVRRVIVDVMVRDSDGKPVHGLDRGDFSVTEDKSPQRILSFDVYDLEKPSISRGPNVRPLPANFFENIPASPERGPLYVILADLVNTDPKDQMWSRQQILSFIRSKPAGTRFAIFATTDKLRLVQGFTDDKDLLYSALDPNRPKPKLPRVFLLGRNYGYGDPYGALDMLTHIGHYLDGIPGRKNLIWAAGKFDIDLFPREEDPVDLQNKIKAEINALAQAQVAVFPLDVRGVLPNPEGALTGARPNGGAATIDPNSPAASAASTPGGDPVGQVSQMQGHGSSSYRDYATEDAVASVTGGRAFYSTNDVTSALDEATEDGGNYYTLTYSPPSHAGDGQCHHISVAVRGAKYQLSYRRYYCRVPLVASDQQQEQTSRSALPIPIEAGDILQANMKPGAPILHDLIFSAHVRTEGVPAMASAQQMAELQEQADKYVHHLRNRQAKPLPPTRVQTYTIDYRVVDPQFTAELARGGKQAALEFAVAGFDADGHVLNGVVNDAIPEASNESRENKAGLFRVRQSFVVPVRAVSVRVGVRDRASDRMGTLEVALPLAPEPAIKSMPAH